MLEKLQTIFSPPVFSIVMTLAIILLALVLVNIMRLRNSTVVGATITVHRNEAVTTVVGSLPASNVAVVTTITNTGEVDTDKINAGVQQSVSTVLSVPATEVPLGKIAPLLKRPALGKKSIKLLDW